jgi:hypothetical protein
VRRRRSLGSTPTLLEENCLFTASLPGEPTIQEEEVEQQESKPPRKSNEALMPMRALCKMLQPPKIVGERKSSRQPWQRRRSSCQF